MSDTISKLVFRPPRPPTPIRRSRYFWIGTDTDGSAVPAFFIKRRGAKVTFLFSHGNAEDLGMTYHRMRETARVLCVNVMAYEYSGYGIRSDVPSTEENCFKNIEAAYAYLLDERGLEPYQIVLYGRSLGSGPTCHLAAKTAREGKSVAGVILHSPFMSIFRVAIDFGFTMVGDLFRNLDRAPEIRCPVLFIHGTIDDVVPSTHSEGLLKLLTPTARVKPYFASGMGHNNIEVYDKNTYIVKITDYLFRYIRASTGGRVPLDPVLVPTQERGGPSLQSEGFNSIFEGQCLCHGLSLMKQAMLPENTFEADAKKRANRFRKKIDKPASIQAKIDRDRRKDRAKPQMRDDIDDSRASYDVRTDVTRHTSNSVCTESTTFTCGTLHDSLAVAFLLKSKKEEQKFTD